MHNCGADTHTFDRLRVDHFVMKHNKMCSLPYTMTANKTYLSIVSRSHTNYAPAAYRCSDYNRNIDKRLARNWYGYARLTFQLI